MKKKKIKIFWPNIGSLKEYQKNLHKILSAVHSNEFTRSELINWVKKEFNSDSIHFCRKLIDIFKAIKLIDITNKKVHLTKNGKQFLETEDTDLLINLMIDNVVGIVEMVEGLKDLGSASYEEYRKAWENKMSPLKFEVNQSRIRADWLRGLGYADMVARQYFLTDKGLKLYAKLKQERVGTTKEREEVSHNDLEDKIKIIGEFFEFEAKKRPSLNEALPSYAIKLKQGGRELDCLWIRYVPFGGKLKFPIEIQLSGNIADTLDRLETVSDYVQKAIIITTEEQEKIIIERLSVKKSRLLEKLVFVSIDDVYKAVEATNVLKSLTKKIFYD